jgi:hypothetical protein
MRRNVFGLINHLLKTNPIRSFWYLILASESSFLIFTIVKPVGPYTDLDLLGLAPMITGPMAATFSCWLMQRNHKLLADFLGSNRNRKSKADFASAFSIAVVLVLSHILIFTISWIYLQFNYQLMFEWEWVWSCFGAIGVSLSYLSAGLVTGRLIRNQIAPVIIGLGGLIIPFLWMILGLNKTLFLTGGSNIDSDYLIFLPKVYIVEMQLLAGMAFLGFTLLLPMKRGLMKAGALGAMSLLFATSILSLQSELDARFEIKITNIETECLGREISVCLPMGVQDPDFLIEKAVTRLNNELERVGVKTTISKIKAVSIGKILSASDEVIHTKNSIPITYRWFSASTEFNPLKFDDYLRNQFESILYPPKCFGYGGIYEEAGKGGNRQFEGYVIYLLMDYPRDVEWLKWMNSKSQTQIDEWIVESWKAIQSCDTVPKL